ncbi:MAG: YfcC family protein [Flavobacteriaceae bacterium]|nr:YfcC family protein [Flavobacteriaceae bacterium]
MHKFKFPSAQTILIILAALVTLLTWIIPAGQYNQLTYNKENAQFVTKDQGKETVYPATQKMLDELQIKISLEKFTNGDIWKPVSVPNTYRQVEAKPQGVLEFIQSPIKGIMAALDIVLLILIIGGFIGITNFTGAFDTGIARLAKVLKGREALLIVLITVLIAIGGTTFGLAEETIAFYPILIPVFLAAKYDAMVAVACIYIGSSIGTMASTVNPFSTIIASNAAGINWTDGITSRFVMLFLGTIVCILYIIRYAEKVKKDPTKSLIYSQKEEIEKLFLHKISKDTPKFIIKIKLILITFISCFAIMIFGVSRLDWWFLEMTSVFLVGAIVIGFIHKMNETKFVDVFMDGAKDLLSVAFIIGLARGITIIMDNGLISDTLLYHSSNLTDGMNKGLFINVMMSLFAGLSFFIPSSSGMAVLTMPIMAPLADGVGIGREIIVNAYQYGMGLFAFINPTGLILASLTMVKVGYDKWLKFVMPLVGILLIITILVLTISVYV